MAVCGRCFICGYKFSCSEDDEAVAWVCNDEQCIGSRSERPEHKICVRCHDVLAHDVVNEAVADLVALVARRSTDLQPAPVPATLGLSALWVDGCPAFAALPGGLRAVLYACVKTNQPISPDDRAELGAWLFGQRRKVVSENEPIDTVFVALQADVLRAILLALVGPIAVQESEVSLG